ncbi:MAG: succinate dehydrogenase, cytochrome b556 subunit [Burkholderiales bacterium]|jgi:succinate dehydrogenase / fumarate reductase cytochrome b subunit
MITADQRPKYLNLFRIRLPLPGWVSILHRISGFALFIFGGALLYLLQEVLRSPEGYMHVRAITGNWLVKLFLVGLLWSFLHHFFAGVRFLLLDVHVAGDLRATRITSAAVLIVSLVLTAIVGVWLW